MSLIARKLLSIDKNFYAISNPRFLASFSYAAQTANNFGIHMSRNGEHLYICSSSPINTYQYSLSTPWDISTASFVRAASINQAVTIPLAIKLSVDGTKLINFGDAASNQYDMLQQFNLSTAWDISTATLESQKQFLGDLDPTPRDLVISDDGLTIVTLGLSTKTLRKFSLSVAFDLSTATQVQTYNNAFWINNSRSIAASHDGMKILYLDSTNNIQELLMTAPWDLSTITIGNLFNPNLDESTALGLDFGKNGKRLYIAGRGNLNVIEYSLS